MGVCVYVCVSVSLGVLSGNPSKLDCLQLPRAIALVDVDLRGIMRALRLARTLRGVRLIRVFRYFSVPGAGYTPSVHWVGYLRGSLRFRGCCSLIQTLRTISFLNLARLG